MGVGATCLKGCAGELIMKESEGGGVVWKGMKTENGLRYASGPIQYKNHMLHTWSDPFVYTWSDSAKICSALL